MEYLKIINLLDNTPNQPTKFTTKNWVETNDSQIRFKTSMLRSRLCNYSYAYILVKGTITVANTAQAGAAANNGGNKVLFKNCAPFTSCISRRNNTQIDDVQYIDLVMPM